ncbi:Pyruvate dehydrogenase E1 component subunit alpha [Lentibacillus sp. JNUCC-1]|nr:Pyruvate dehydrogenase E1 component subunit alpha [Lentibacillus sp. JNUCC-1]
MKGTDNVAIAYFGDGATSEGDFHEGLNFAGVFQTPVVLFNQNNGYAISVPFEKQTNSKTIAQKAIAYDIPSVRIDGNDCFAVYFATKQAVETARKGEGPTLIEAVTWRTGAHTTADDPTKYRPDHLGADKIDPLDRLERFMKKHDYWDAEKIADMEEQRETEVEQAVKEMESYTEANVADMFDHVFNAVPSHLAQQKSAYMEDLKEES